MEKSPNFHQMIEIDSAEVEASPFNKLVKLVGRAFYDNLPFKNGRRNNIGMAVVVLDALTRREWVKEDDLAEDLKLNPKLLRQCLQFFEKEKLITRVDRKEKAKAKSAQKFGAAVDHGKERVHTYSYSCLDYAQIYDVVKYRYHRMKDGLGCTNTVEEYVCSGCKRRYNALDALQLMGEEGFHCENCNGELVAESDKLASNEMGYGDDTARRRRRKLSVKEMDAQLKPLLDQLDKVKECLPCPEFGTLQEWEARASATQRAAYNDASGNDPSKSSQGYAEARSVELSGAAVKEVGAIKVMPPWMITQGMNLTKEQREEVTTDRQVGMKSKREADDDVEWEYAPTTGTATENYNLDVAVEESEEDGIDWEEG